MTKRLFTFILLTVMVCACGVSAFVGFKAARNKNNLSSLTSDRAILSELSEDEQLAFLQEQGIDIPSIYSDFIISWITIVEEDPDFVLAITNPVLYRIGEDVRTVVNEYYQWGEDDLRMKDNTVLSELSEDEQLAFLQEQGIDIPSIYSDFIISWITIVEEDPDFVLAITNPVLYRIGEDVRTVVNEYYREG